MRLLKIAVISWLVFGLSAPAFAGDLQASIAKAVQQPTAPTERGPIPKQYLWPGTVLFIGGMALAFDGFLNNRNGKFPEPGEATATNVKLGAAGLTAAFAGGTLLLLGKRQARRSPSLTFGSGKVTVSHKLAW